MRRKLFLPIVGTPFFARGLSFRADFQKEGVNTVLFVEGGCWERGDNFLGGVKGRWGLKFLHKNKLKSEIFFILLSINIMFKLLCYFTKLTIYLFWT